MDNSFDSLARQYTLSSLSEDQVDKSPLVQLSLWISDAVGADCPEPTAMVLSTCGKDLRPSSRVVLLKGLDVNGITFYTNYDSRKGLQLLDNPQASLLYFWPDLERQVRVEGLTGKVTPEESDAYFKTRAEASRVSASISPQSREIPGREWLEERIKAHISGISGQGSGSGGIGNRPANWGGYILAPVFFEFWQGREDRLHDRIIYRLIAGRWKISRLAP
jgi:pyridoxamine 5'-phosphate oxidase